MALTVASLHLYPVKGLKAIDVRAARCTDRGLEHDRRWMVVDAQGRFLSQREHPRMATIWTDLDDGSLLLSAPEVSTVEVPVDPPPSAPTLTVRVWSSVCEALAPSRQADAWLSDYLGMPCRLVYMPDSTRRLSNPQYAHGERLVSFADGYAFLVIGQASLDDLNTRLAANGAGALPMNRFRPSIVVAGSAPYAEDAWDRVRVGEAILRAAKPCGRCEVTTTDQATGEVRGPEPLATLAAYRSSDEFGVMFGMNYVVEKTGRIAFGDAVAPA